MLVKVMHLNNGMRGGTKRRRIRRNRTMKTTEKNSAMTAWLSQRQMGHSCPSSLS